MTLISAAFASLVLGQATPSPAPPQPPEPAPAIRVEERSPGRTFAFGRPVEVQDIPALRSRFEGMRARARLAADPCVAEEGLQCPEVGYNYNHEWQWLGRGGPLISLVGTNYAFEGGAHGNSDFAGMIWDADAAREVAMADLFQQSEWPERFRARYCAALNREREERRGEPVDPGGEEFLSGCPALGEAVALPVDIDSNGRFDTLRISLPPYAAGPYSEGAYEPEIHFTSEDLAALLPEHRAAFEVRR